MSAYANTSTNTPHSASSEPTPPAAPRVLIADDDPYIREMLIQALESDGYEAISAADGHELVRLAQEHAPNIILVDLMMPHMDGYEAIRQMRNDTRIAHIPMLILTARTRPKDVVIGFETGADDYIAKPFDLSELLARVKSHLRRAAQRPVLNPLTGLPGGLLFSEELRRRLAHQEPLALLYADLDNFKALNDIYGFSRGDQAILLVGHVLREAIAAHGAPNDFLGHIGGDDFAILSTPDRVDPLCRAIMTSFEREIRQLYHPSDRRRGYLTSVDRYGILRRFGLTSISIGVVTTARRPSCSESEITRIAAEMKHYAKTQPGNSYAVDQRISHQFAHVERRGMHQRSILIVSDDASLRLALRSPLQEKTYQIYEAADIDSFRTLLDHTPPPALIIADAQFGEPLWAFCAAHSTPPMIILAQDDEEIAQAKTIKTAICLQLPLPLADILLCVDRLIVGERSQNMAS